MTQPDSVLRQRVNGTFVGPVAMRQDQPSPRVVPIDWNAYDVPRLWDMVRREDDEIAWGQAKGFENLAQLLLAHHDSLVRLRGSLSGAWDPGTGQAAAKFLAFLDELIRSMAEDAVAHACTSRAMHAVLTVLRETKQKIGQLKQEWDQVTTDLTPEWWDQAADQLNQRARATVADADAAVGDYRRQLTVPTQYVYPTVERDKVPGQPSGTGNPAVPRDLDAAEPPAALETGAENAAETGVVKPPPPIPGHDPVLRRGPELAGLPHVPQPVAALPGSPISLLPVPPGNPFAVGGGAYVLPGPGIGQGRRIYPMPPPVSAATGSAPGVSRSPAEAGPQPGAAPASAPAGGVTNRAGSERAGRRMMVWQVAQGVAPVIGQVAQETELAEEQLRLAGEAFPDWFADLATPWTDDLKVAPPRQAGPNR